MDTSTRPPSPAGDDLVVLLAASTWGEEIRFALRSFERHCPVSGRLWIVGHLPPYLDPDRVVHVPEELVAPRGVFVESEARRLLNDHADLSDRYVFAPDDCYLLDDVTVDEFGPLRIQDLSQVTNRGSNPWQRMLWRTHDLLVHMGYPAVNYEAHVPTRVDREAYRAIAERFVNIEAVAHHRYHGVCSVSAYWNMVDDRPGDRCADDHRVGLVDATDAPTVEQVVERADGKTFLYHDDAGLTPALRQFLAMRFPTPSRFEIATAPEPRLDGEPHPG